MKRSFYSFLILFLFLSFTSCSNESSDKNSEEETDFTCAGTSCKTNADCTCSTDFCMPEEMAGMPTYGPINALHCTKLNCDVADNSTCPEGYECWPLSMGKDYFPEETESLCIKMPEETEDEDNLTDDIDIVQKDDESVHDDDVLDSDGDEIVNVDDDISALNDEDSQIIDDEPLNDSDVNESEWPSCYDDSCESSDECCDGTSCLPSAMSFMFGETNYCVIKGCTEGDASSCPAEHECKGGMGLTYCVKAE